MKIKLNKNVVRNNGYNLSSIDIVVYSKLKEISNNNKSLKIDVDQSSFKKSISIKDNRTLKRSLDNLFRNNLIERKVLNFNSKGSSEIILSKVPEDTFEFDTKIFEYLGELNVPGIHIALYLLTYCDNTENNYMNVINQTTVGKRLNLNKETIVKYMKILKEHKEFSYLADELKFMGKIKYNENYTLPQKKSTTRRFLENKLEDELVKHITLIEEGMTYVGRQIQVPDGRIDIVGRDKDNTLCIIELKVTPNDEKIVFQSVYYPTQFEEPTRMITITPDYDYKIKISLDALGVERKLYRYENNTLIISNCS